MRALSLDKLRPRGLETAPGRDEKLCYLVRLHLLPELPLDALHLIFEAELQLL